MEHPETSSNAPKLNRAAVWLLAAVEHARFACERTRLMLAIAIARFWTLLALQEAACA
jgi:hypothetical protein